VSTTSPLEERKTVPHYERETLPESWFLGNGTMERSLGMGAALLPTVLIYASVHACGCSQVFGPSHKKAHLCGFLTAARDTIILLA
jgi:hypothetical protein